MQIFTSLKQATRWLTFSLFLMSSNSVAQDVAFANNRQSPLIKEKEFSDYITPGSLLSEIEKKHTVSFTCRSEIPESKINTDKLNFKSKAFVDAPVAFLPNGNAVFEATLGTSYTTGNYLENEQKSAVQVIRISGTVTVAATRLALQGVTVAVKGTSMATVTDEKGSYEINVPNEQSTLVFSYVGYLTAERLVNNQQRIDVVLEEGIKSMDEVVVVGYGTQKKVNLTGAVSAVRAEDLQGRPITATSSSLQGLLPGVTIRSFTGLPGQNGSSIRIRGIGTLGDSNPLIVIDGIPGGSMDILNPDDIESISVLKDAASSSIYGVRGANGVILVTTKKGRANAKPIISYSNYFGFQTPTALPEFLGSPDYMTLLNESQRNVGRTPTYTDSQINIAKTGADLNYYANTNWLEEIYKDRAGQQNHNLSINGGGNNLSYYLSYGYLKQDGLVTGDNFGANRNNVRLRLTTKLIDRLDIDANVGYVDRKYSESSEDVSEAGGPIYASHQ
ncbi:MAG TPA: SusC/RagA family TonB-linked outer membrane protein, partial [Chitinophagaceae bacterium]|nr:SusC/RagA family TonB-linked outer membrane protein [Chitinophagaceae bacterium]